MKRGLIGAAILLALGLAACAAQPTGESLPAEAEEETEAIIQEEETTMLQLTIGDTAVAVDWEENESVRALAELCRSEALTVEMSRYGGFEQVGPLGASLPRSDVQTTTQAGDIVLYAGDQIVVFYGSNAWAYTRLGHISDRSARELAELLGREDVTLTLSAEAGR